MRLIGCVLMVAALIACTSKSGEITVYAFLCTESIQNEKCSGKWLPLNATVYRVSEDHQTVIYWTPGIVDSPRELTKCIVQDVKNWQCTFPDSSANVYMDAGHLTAHVNDDTVSVVTRRIEMRKRYVGWFKYWRFRLTGVLQ